MKVFNIALTLVLVITMLFSFSACAGNGDVNTDKGNNPDSEVGDQPTPKPPHEHTFSSEWSKDEEKHWHAATCEHSTLVEDEAEHRYENGVCVCGQEEPKPPHEHTFSSEWSKDEEKHWHAATCEHSTLVEDEAEHRYENGVCVCGQEEPKPPHEHTFSSEWSKDEEKHWRAATCEHSTLVEDEAEHRYENGVCVCGQEEPDYGPEPADIIKNGTPIGTMTQLFKMSAYVDSENRNCRVLQGGCTDGTYYYAIMNDSLKDAQGNHSPDSSSTILKYEIATKKLVATYPGLMVEHANDATYRSDTNELIIAHCSPNKNLLSIFDCSTMELKRKVTIESEIYSISFDPYEKCYWVGLSYGDSFAKMDLDFKLISTYEGIPFGYTRQGMDVDSKYIYFSRYNPNCILVYDKEGNFVDRIGLSTTSYEVENIFHIGDDFYIGYYTSSAGGRLYKLELTSGGGSGEVKVDMDKLFTFGQRTDADGNVCKVAQCSATDGVYIYLFMNNDIKTDYISSLYKYEIATGKIVATLDGFRTGHTNDVTYNSKTEELIVVHNSPAYTLTVIDAKTLEVKRTLTIKSDIYALAYDEVNDCYYGADRATRGFIRMNAEFDKTADLTEGVITPYSRQAIDTDGEYIYMLQSAANCVLVYRVDGSFVGLSYLIPSANTAQSICHFGDSFYIGYNVSKSGGILYSAEIEIK